MRNKVLLVFPPYTRQALSDYQPIGISCIASAILNKCSQLDVKLLDYTVEKFSPGLYRKELQDFRPEIVGISVLTLNYPSGRLLAQLTRDFNPTILIIMGGVHATMKPEKCLNYCDIVVRGEGEETFYEIVQGNEWKGIKGISYWKDGEIVHNEKRERIENLDELPLPAHHLFKMKKYRAFPAWGIMGSRGCPYNCIFCASPQMWGRIIRFRSPLSIVDEIEYLHQEFGIQHITFFDDTINIPQQRAIEICNETIKRKLHKKMSFECQLRANKQLISVELFKKLKEANFVTIGIGIESGSERILQSMKKSLTLDEAREAIKMARRVGIKEVKGFFMVGNWDETIRDIFRTWRFILSNNTQPAFSICTPFPGTSFYYLLKDQGYMVNDPDWTNLNQTTPIVRTNKMSRFSIFAVFVLSILLQFAFSFSRGGNAKHTALRMIYHTLDIVKLGIARLTKLSREV
jgi:radical SAM superfamily enzyme YgiQ (UPF0313 family)